MNVPRLLISAVVLSPPLRVHLWTRRANPNCAVVDWNPRISREGR
jgi:hypothetical protein